MSRLQVAGVKYQVATYQGEITVNCFDDDDDGVVIAKAKQKLRRECGGSLPFGYESFEVVEREDA